MASFVATTAKPRPCTAARFNGSVRAKVDWFALRCPNKRSECSDISLVWDCSFIDRRLRGWQISEATLHALMVFVTYCAFVAAVSAFMSGLACASVVGFRNNERPLLVFPDRLRN